MKKFLLLAAVALLTATGMQAQRFVNAKNLMPRQSTEKIFSGKTMNLITPMNSLPKDPTTILTGTRNGKASRAGEVDPTKILSYCPWNVANISATDLTAAGLPQNSTYFLGTYFNSRMVQAFAGNQITEITTWLSPTATNVWFQILKPNGEVLFEEGGTANDVGGTQGKQVTYTLKEPYTIQADQPIIVGYTADFGEVVGLPYFQAGSILNGALVGGYENDEFTGFQSSDSGQENNGDFAPGMGLGMYVECMTTGDAGLNANDVEVLGVTPGRIKAGETCDITFALTNWGSELLRNMEAYVSFDNGATAQKASVNIPAQPSDYTAFGMTTMATVQVKAPESIPSAAVLEGPWMRVIGQVASVNSEKDSYTDNNDNISAAAMMLVENSLRRPVLVEEFTGQWCGWCVRGLEGMEAAKAAFPNLVTIISSHFGNAQNYDGFVNETYASFGNSYGAGYPSCLISRTRNFTAYDPYGATFLNGISDVIEHTGCEAAMGVASEVDGNTVNVTAALKPTMDGLNPEYYTIAFALTEDGLTGKQTNYYSSDFSEDSGLTKDDIPSDLQKYFDMPATIDAIYNDVPRFATSPFGIEGSVAGLDLAKDKTVTYNYSFAMPEGVNADNLNVIAMLVCMVSGEVVAVQSAPLGEEAFSTGIQTVQGAQAAINVTEGAINISAAQGDAQLYTVDGKLVRNITVNGSASIPTFGLKGVYVVRVADGNNITSKKVQF